MGRRALKARRTRNKSVLVRPVQLHSVTPVPLTGSERQSASKSVENSLPSLEVRRHQRVYARNVAGAMAVSRTRPRVHCSGRLRLDGSDRRRRAMAAVAARAHRARSGTTPQRLRGGLPFARRRRGLGQTRLWRRRKLADVGILSLGGLRCRNRAVSLRSFSEDPSPFRMTVAAICSRRRSS